MPLTLTSARWGLIFCMAFAVAASHAAPTQPCRVQGLPNEVQCGVLQRAMDPARPAGPKIDVRYIVVPAMARNKQPDAVLVLAGGPGQSAIDIAPIHKSGVS